MIKKYWKICILSVVLVIIAEAIGQKQIHIGVGYLVLLPMLFALLMGGLISWQKWKLIAYEEMESANRVMGVVVMLFVAKLGSQLGPSLLKLLESGWALVFQELGHFFGTIALGLPIAILLGMKREAVGATFSIDREPNLAIIADKYGMDSPEGRGVMTMYICGTLFGAIYLGLLAGYLGSLHIFDPLALAMGSGVGSGSMMAAASGAIAATFPERAEEIATFAAASNLLTTLIGVYFALFISLPVANKLYAWMEPKVSRRRKGNSDETETV